MLRTKLTHTFQYNKIKQHLYLLNSPTRKPQHRFMFNNCKCTSPYFLNFTYCIKSTDIHGILRNCDPTRQMYIFFPVTNKFPIDDARPLIVLHREKQPIEITLLKNHNTKFNHKLYSLIQNTKHEFSPHTKKLTSSKC